VGEGLAILAAVAFAVGTVLQQRGTLATEAGEDDPRFLVQILHDPLWLAGGVVQAIGWVLQAAALDRGSLVVVQSITSLSLVLALPLGVWLTGQHVGRRETTGALLSLAGIILFLSAGQPHGGTTAPSAAVWWAACLITLGLVAALTGLGWHSAGAPRALTFGMAAGLAFGLQAAVTKTFVAEIGGGVLELLATWSVYVLIFSAIVGFVCQQSALKSGVLAPAMASSNSVTLFSSVVLGVTVYGEHLSSGGAGHVASAYFGLAVAIGGVALLAGSAAPTRENQRPDQPAGRRSGSDR
jgi:drug/metabolite transporter (DMT)-like permease